jgi:pyruvate dehydrogenase E1 component alpha subunit
MASIWKLPVVYVCENNQYAMSMAITKSANVAHISQRAASYGIPGVTVDGNDPQAVHDAVCEAAERARAGQGPSLVEALTYRWKGHSKSDKQAYRTREEVGEWQRRDPIRRWAAVHGLTDLQLEAERAAAQAEIDAAVAFAEASPEPRLEDILEGVYA